MNPKYPVYIISKGRWESRYTADILEYMNVPYNIIVEPHEYLQYAAVINSKKILVLPFSNLGQGSIPARNFAWEHSIRMGAERHWILDDNIKYFYRLYENKKIPFNSGTVFKIIEDFVDRYTNISLAGMQYEYFCPRKSKVNVLTLNTRIYSCILIDNNIPFRWRGMYNEDTDLSLRVLKAGLCTILTNCFLCGKIPTLTMKGGNSSIYSEKLKGRTKMAESLVKQHPDVTTVAKIWNRDQHKVDYSSFKTNTPIPKKGIKVKKGIDNYGLTLISLNESKSISKYRKNEKNKVEKC